MFAFHGWLSLWDTDRLDEFGDRDNTLRAETLARVRERIDDCGNPLAAGVHGTVRDVGAGSLVVLHSANGGWNVAFSGLRNHRHPWLSKLFVDLGRIAPGSYGVLHVRDDEASESDWRRHLMIRGTVTERPDSDLAPHIPKLEDD